MLTEFSNNSSNHRDSLLTKFLWGFVIFISYAIFIIHSSFLLSKYLHSETTVTVNLDGKKFQVPDIYICNNYGASKFVMNRALLLGDRNYLKFAEYIDEDHDRLLNAIMNHKAGNFTSEFIYQTIRNRDYKDFVDKYIKLQNEWVSVKKIFSQVPHFIHHFCYKLNEEYKKLFLQNSALIVRMYTDALWIKSDNNNFTSDNRKELFPLKKYPRHYSDSHILYFVPSGEYPHPTSAHVHLGAGKEFVVEMEMDYFNRVQKKRTPCSEKYFQVSYLNLLNSSQPITYNATPTDCKLKQFQNDQLQKENCVFGILPLSVDVNKSRSVKYCPSNGVTYNDLYQELNHRSIHQVDYRSCQEWMVCSLPVYKLQSFNLNSHEDDLEVIVNASKTNHPDIFEYQYLHQQYVSRRGEMTLEKMMIDSQVRNSFIQIKIFATKLLSTEWDEQFSYEMKSFLSDLAGILGFYTGVSLITVLEIFTHAAKYISSKKSKVNRKDGSEAGESHLMT